MKRVFSLIVLAILGTTLTIQAQHLKFMNIPLDGTITNFQTKLAQKGFRPDVETNKSIDVGCRMFKGGTFSGETAQLFVYYNPKTKTVYRAKAVITCVDKSHVKRLFDQFRDNLGDKYEYRSDFITEEEGDYENGKYFIFNTDGKHLGTIALYVSEEFIYTLKPHLHIDYYDITNYNYNSKINSDDL